MLDYWFSRQCRLLASGQRKEKWGGEGGNVLINDGTSAQQSGTIVFYQACPRELGDGVWSCNSKK